MLVCYFDKVPPSSSLFSLTRTYSVFQMESNVQREVILRFTVSAIAVGIFGYSTPAVRGRLLIRLDEWNVESLATVRPPHGKVNNALLNNR